MQNQSIMNINTGYEINSFCNKFDLFNNKKGLYKKCHALEIFMDDQCRWICELSDMK